jgi:hypothetical protein
VYLFKSIFSSPRQTVCVVLSVVCIEGRIGGKGKVLERVLVLCYFISVCVSESANWFVP